MLWLSRLLLVLLCWLVTAPAWAWTYVGVSTLDASSDTASGTSITVNVPSGTANNDIMFCVVKYPNTETLTAPGGWTLPANGSYNDTTASNTIMRVYYRLAASEPASYNWTIGAAGRFGGSCYTFRGDFNTTTPFDVDSSTSYTTSDTTTRASLTTSAANEPLIWFSVGHDPSSVTTTPPTVPTTFTEHTDEHNTGSRFWRSVASVLWTGSGATGNMDGTLSGTKATVKHAFAIALQPAAAGATVNFFSRRLQVSP